MDGIEFTLLVSADFGNKSRHKIPLTAKHQFPASLLLSVSVT